MTTGTLQELVTTQQIELAALAHAWLASGATCFVLSDDEGRVLAHWPRDSDPPPSPQCRAPIQLNGTTLGHLAIVGPDTTAAQVQLEAEAALIAQLTRLVAEQESMVAELIETQDQLLTVYDLTQSDCYHSFYVDIEPLLRCLIREVARLLKTAGGFMLLDKDGHRQVVCFPPELNARSNRCMECLQSDDNELILSRDTSPGILSPGTENLLYVPVQIRADMRIGLGLINKNDGFTAPDLKLVRTIAEQAAARIDNFLLHQETLKQATLQTEMEMARQVQFRLLPQSLPVVEGLDIYADWRPSRQASGDFYDFQVHPDHPMLFTIGDVSGKGMPAALLTVESLTEIRSQTRVLTDPTPAIILRYLNETLYHDFSQTEMMSTLFVAQYDPQCCELRYANAGHAPIIYCPCDGSATLLKANDPPIGILPAIPYQDETFVLQPGDILIAATDGLNESFNADGEMFGYQRLLDAVNALRDCSAQDIANGIFAAIDEFTGRTSDDQFAPQAADDDQAIIIIKANERSISACMPRNRVIRLEMPARKEYLDIPGTGIVTVLEHETNLGQPDQTIYEVRLAVQELCANIVEHAYRDTEGYIAILLTLSTLPHRLIIETTDTGTPFDPSFIPQPGLLDDRGRGLSLMRSLLQDIRYHAYTDQAWQSLQGEPWQPIEIEHPQPGRNYWRLVKYL